MYCIKRTEYERNEATGEVSIASLAYLKYDGWQVFPKPPLDLKGVMLFTEREAQVNELPPNMEFLWYGAYKR